VSPVPRSGTGSLSRRIVTPRGARSGVATPRWALDFKRYPFSFYYLPSSSGASSLARDPPRRGRTLQIGGTSRGFDAALIDQACRLPRIKSLDFPPGLAREGSDAVRFLSAFASSPV